MAKKESTKLGVSIGLISTFCAAQAGGTPVYGTVTPNVEVGSAYYFTMVDGGSGYIFDSLHAVGSFPADEIANFQVVAPNTPVRDGFLGVYDGKAFVAIDPVRVIDVLGQTFETVFPTYAETDFVNALTIGDTGYLLSFISDNQGLWGGLGEHQALKFTGATLGGTVHTSLVPEPATLGALSVGLVTLLRRRRR